MSKTTQKLIVEENLKNLKNLKFEKVKLEENRAMHVQWRKFLSSNIKPKSVFSYNNIFSFQTSYPEQNAPTNFDSWSTALSNTCRIYLQFHMVLKICWKLFNHLFYFRVDSTLVLRSPCF